MIVAGVAQIAGSDGPSAARDAAHRAMTRAATLRPDLAILLATPDHAGHLREMSRAVAAQTHARHVVAASTLGTFAPDGEIEDEHGTLVMALGGDVEARPFLVPARGRSYEAGCDVGVKAGPEAKLIVVLVDPAGLEPDEFLDGLAHAASGVHVAGAGLNGGEGGAVEILDDEEVSGHIVGISFAGRIRAAVTTSQACRPLGRARAVTACEGSVVLALDDRPALEVFAEAASDPALGGVEWAAQNLSVGLARNGNGDYVVRPIVGFDVGRGGLAIGDVPSLGQLLFLAVREAMGARDDLRRRVAAAAGALKTPPAFGFYFNCAGRGSHLYGAQNVDARTLRQTLGDIALGGCFSSFEIASTAGRPEMHLFSGVMALVAES